ncbi:MAG: hypothetical protein IJP86_06960, partial [Synergistaceae bacterium]|nr:hypothetical protein [Synergistaceae bacterium]
MRRKLILALLIILIIPSLSPAEETKELAADYVARIQDEISADISHLRASLEAELDGINLDSPDIAARIQELEQLTARASEDMAAWGYTPEQRQLHTNILSELITAYSAYGSLIQSQQSQPPASDDVSSLGSIASPDINSSDSLRQEIAKVSRGLDVQVFYLQSKISKLRLDLAEASSLRRQLKAAQEGGEALELPHTHILSLENARINAALTRLQVRAQKAAFDSNVRAILRFRRQLADMQGKISFTKELLDANVEALQARISELTEEMTSARKSLSSANSALK